MSTELNDLEIVRVQVIDGGIQEGGFSIEGFFVVELEQLEDFVARILGLYEYSADFKPWVFLEVRNPAERLIRMWGRIGFLERTIILPEGGFRSRSPDSISLCDKEEAR